MSFVYLCRMMHLLADLHDSLCLYLNEDMSEIVWCTLLHHSLYHFLIPMLTFHRKKRRAVLCKCYSLKYLQNGVEVSRELRKCLGVVNLLFAYYCSPVTTKI